MRGLTYWLRNRMYISVTNETNSVSCFELRGPSFKLPENSNFFLLDSEPSPSIIYDTINEAFEKEMISVSSMDSDYITFAGYGEPILRKQILMEAAELIKSKRHGVPLRIKSNGLIKSTECKYVANCLKTSGIDMMSISLLSDNPNQYGEIAKPLNNLKFQDVCSFVMACVEADLHVTCTAVERPGVNIGKVRNLAHALGATNFETYSYHP